MSSKFSPMLTEAEQKNPSSFRREFGLAGFDMAVVKPCVGMKSNGVTNFIRVEATLRRAFDLVAGEPFVVEEHIYGRDFRASAVRDDVVMVHERVAANVVGDGHHTVQHLIDAKNVILSRHPETARRQVKVDDDVLRMLHDQDMDLSSIPEEGAHIRLRGASNIAIGGDNFDVSADVHPAFIQEFERVAKAIRGNLMILGMDFCAPSVEQIGEGPLDYTMLEVNVWPNVNGPMMPSIGRGRNIRKSIVAAVIDEYGLTTTFDTFKVQVFGTMNPSAFRRHCKSKAYTMGIDLKYEEQPDRSVILSGRAGRKSIDVYLSLVATHKENDCVFRVDFLKP